MCEKVHGMCTNNNNVDYVVAIILANIEVIANIMTTISHHEFEGEDIMV